MENSPLSKLTGLSEADINKIGVASRSLSAFTTVLSVGQSSEEERQRALMVDEQEKNFTCSLTYRERVAFMVKHLLAQKGDLEADILNRKILIQSCLNDIAESEMKMAQIDFLVQHLERYP